MKPPTTKKNPEEVIRSTKNNMKFWQLFVPNKESKKRAYLLKPRLLASYAFLILSLIVSNYFIVTGVKNVLGYATNINIKSLLQYTNEKRAEAKLNSLTLNSALSKAAEQKANDMFAKDYWAHVSPDGKEPWDFIVASGYDYTYAGENLAVDFADSKKVVQAWYDSKSHRDNLLNPNYTEIGFAVVNGELQGRKTTLVVQMFGKPRQYARNISSEGESSQFGLAEVTGVSTKTVTEKNNGEQTTRPTSTGLSEESTIEIETGKEMIENASQKPVTSGKVLDTATVFNFSRFLALILGLFLTILFAIDGYFVRRLGIPRISGHTFLHILVLILALAGVWYTSVGMVL